MASHDFNRAILAETAHRPWPMPNRAWLMTQTWHNLLFAHWPVMPDLLQANVPSAFVLDVFDGTAWIGIVPFRMTNVAPRAVPAIPRLSEFPELNVRTYVRRDGKPGVFFFSLDAGNALAAWTAKLLLNLPYYFASMRVRSEHGTIFYESRRAGGRRPAELSARYRAVGSPSPPRPGSLEYFLTERYCLYALDRRRKPYRLDIHHPPWPLQAAEAEIDRNTMTDPVGIELPRVQPLLHFAKRQDMVAWAPERL